MELCHPAAVPSRQVGALRSGGYMGVSMCKTPPFSSLDLEGNSVLYMGKYDMVHVISVCVCVFRSNLTGI